MGERIDHVEARDGQQSLTPARMLWAAAVVGLAFTVAQAATGLGGRPLQLALLSAVVGLVSLACVGRALGERHDLRAAWILLAVGLAGLGALGIEYVAEYAEPLSFPSELPVGLIGYPLTLAAWALLAARRLPGLPRAPWLDSAIGGLAFATVGGGIAYHALFGGGYLPKAEASQLVYIVADLTLTGTMFMAGLLAGTRRAKTLLLLAAGAAGLSIVDIVFGYRIEGGHDLFGPNLAAGWVAALVLAGAAAAVTDDPPVAKPRGGFSLVAIPVIAPAAAIGVPLADWGESPFLTWLAVTVGLLSLARLAISLVDNQRAEERRRREEEERRAREQAERANRQKTAFLGRMSHEVRTPLNSILGFAQLLVDDVDGDQRESVERILRGGNHLRRLIDDILDLSSIEAGETAIEIETVPLDSAIDESIALMEPLARRSGVRIARSDAHDAPAGVRADGRRLEQVLLNLISNAVKYGGAGSEVIVGVGPAAGRARVAVTDTGPGIADEHLGKLFTPFERGPARGSGIEGSGLGLALTKNLVEAMNGRIGVSTGPAGSTFWFELPAAPVAEAVTAAGGALDRQTVAEGPHTILYVEDKLSNIAVVERMLARRADYDLVTATTGRAGVELAAAVRPDAVLLDLDLPDMRGEHVLADLRADAATAGIPVVVVSADATAWRQEQLLRAGAEAYVIKPLDMAGFLTTLDGVLGRSAAHAS